MFFLFSISLGFFTVVGLSLAALLAMLLYMAAKVDQAVDPESALLWHETGAKGLKWWRDVQQNERGSMRIDETASAAANA
jgi:hypothetical protein